MRFMLKFLAIFVVLAVLCACSGGSSSQESGSSQDVSSEVIEFADSNLEACVREALGLDDNERITVEKAQTLTELWCDYMEITDLSGLEHFTGLEKLYLYENQISDIKPLGNLTRLKVLDLSGNQISDIRPLESLTNLQHLNLTSNQIIDISPLANLSYLQELYLCDNPITDYSPITGLSLTTCACCEFPECLNATAVVIVTNALTGDPIAGAIVTILGYYKITNSEGRVVFEGLPEGNNIVVAVSAEGYISRNTTVNLVCGENVTVSISLMPEGDIGVTQGDIRIVLTWGQHPEDLDSHLTGPRNDSDQRFHVYFWNTNNCGNHPCDPNIPAWLDVDDTTSYGPETITITKVNGHFVPGCYRYSVHHYYGSSNIPQSGARVEIYVGGELMRTYTPPEPQPNQQVGSGWFWIVCDIVISEDDRVEIIDVNVYSSTFNDTNIRSENIPLFRNLPEKNYR